MSEVRRYWATEGRHRQRRLLLRSSSDSGGRAGRFDDDETFAELLSVLIRPLDQSQVWKLSVRCDCSRLQNRWQKASTNLRRSESRPSRPRRPSLSCRTVINRHPLDMLVAARSQLLSEASISALRRPPSARRRPWHHLGEPRVGLQSPPTTGVSFDNDHWTCRPVLDPDRRGAR